MPQARAAASARVPTHTISVVPQPLSLSLLFLGPAPAPAWHRSRAESPTLQGKGCPPGLGSPAPWDMPCLHRHHHQDTGSGAQALADVNILNHSSPSCRGYWVRCETTFPPLLLLTRLGTLGRAGECSLWLKAGQPKVSRIPTLAPRLSPCCEDQVTPWEAHGSRSPVQRHSGKEQEEPRGVIASSLPSSCLVPSSWAGCGSGYQHMS